MTDLNNQNVGNNMPIQSSVFPNPKGAQSDLMSADNISDKKVGLDSLNLDHAAACGRSMVNGINKSPAMDEATIQKNIRASLRNLKLNPKAAVISMQVYDLMINNGYSEEDASRASDMLYNDLTVKH